MTTPTRLVHRYHDCQVASLLLLPLPPSRRPTRVLRRVVLRLRRRQRRRQRQRHSSAGGGGLGGDGRVSGGWAWVAAAARGSGGLTWGARGGANGGPRRSRPGRRSGGRHTVRRRLPSGNACGVGGTARTQPRQLACSGMAIIFMKCTKLAAPESRLTPSPAVLDVRHNERLPASASAHTAQRG